MQRIIKKGTNNVAVETYYHDNGDDVTVHTESYGQDRIDTEMQNAVSLKEEWTNKDMDAYKTTKIAMYQERIDNLTSIQEAMDE